MRQYTWVVPDKDIIGNGTNHFRKIARRVSGKLQNEFASEKMAAINGAKNSRKPRNGKGRGLPKKGGAGGKGTWGKPGEELGEEDFIDKRDPNYDSESSDDVVAQITIPELDSQELSSKIEPVIQEYFNHGNTQEVLDALTDLNIPANLRPAVACAAISAALDRRDSDKELISVLLSELSHPCGDHERRKSSFVSLTNGNGTHVFSNGNGHSMNGHVNNNKGKMADELPGSIGRQISRPLPEFVLTRDHFKHAFGDMLNDLNDTSVDIPGVDEMIGNFMARAIADDCFDIKCIDEFEHEFAESRDPLIMSALNRARYLLNYHKDVKDIEAKFRQIRTDVPSAASLLKVWGVSGGTLPTKTLRKTMDHMLREYISYADWYMRQNGAAKPLNNGNYHHIGNGDSSNYVQTHNGGDVAVKKEQNPLEYASRALRNLNVPHFNHEYVFRAIKLALTAGTKTTALKIKHLLAHMLNDDGVLDCNAIEMGFERAIESMSELNLAIPGAQALFEKFVEMCCDTNDDETLLALNGNPMGHLVDGNVFNDQPYLNGIAVALTNGIGPAGDHVMPQKGATNGLRSRTNSTGPESLASILTKDIITKIPNKGRKRFVSEGDGGMLKETICDFK